jgi:hypothetical protein
LHDNAVHTDCDSENFLVPLFRAKLALQRAKLMEKEAAEIPDDAA